MRVLPSLAALMFSATVVCAQEDRPTRLIPEKDFIAEPFDRYGNISWEHEKARLDNFAIQIQNDPQMIGYIVVFGDKNGCLLNAQRRAVRARNYLVHYRGIDPNRVIWQDLGYLDEQFVTLEGQLRGAEPYPYWHPKPLPASEVKLKRCANRRTRPVRKRGRA
jgi:hypothetical protein